MMRANFWSGMVVFATAAVLLLWLIPNFVGKGFGGSISPKFMPLVGVTIMMAASASVWIKALRSMLRDKEALLAPVNFKGALFQIWPFAFVALAIICISEVGLIYSGPFMITALLLILGERRPKVILPAAILPPAFIWFMATQLMRVGMV